MFLIFLVISEALERLLLKRFTFETNTHIPDHLLEVSNDPERYSNETLGKCQSIIKQYEHLRNRVKKESLVKQRNSIRTNILHILQYNTIICLEVYDFVLFCVKQNQLCKIWIFLHRINGQH